MSNKKVKAKPEQNNKKSKKRIYKITAAVLSSVAVVLAFILIQIVSSAKEIPTLEKLDSNYNELFTNEELKEKGHVKVNDIFTSDVSIGFNNKDDTKSVYIYASPIRYYDKDQTLKIIDTRIINDEKNNQKFPYTVAANDIVPRYPKDMSKNNGFNIEKNDFVYSINFDTEMSSKGKYVEKSNFVGKKRGMIEYDNLICKDSSALMYPSNIGSNCELYFKKKPIKTQFTFQLQLSDSKQKVKVGQGGYIYFSKSMEQNDGSMSDEVTAVIQKPIIRNKNGDILLDSSFIVSDLKEGKYSVDVNLDSNITENSTVFMSFEMRREKQPDNTLYSAKPDLQESYLCNYLLLGNSKEYGIGRHMIRYKLSSTVNRAGKDVVKAVFHTYGLTSSEDVFEIVPILDDWCSVTGDWNSNYKTGDKISEFKSNGTDYSFDITREVSEWINDTEEYGEHCGVMLKSVEEKENDFNVLLSNDNSLINNFTEVIVK